MVLRTRSTYVKGKRIDPRHDLSWILDQVGLKKNGCILNSLNRGGPDAALRPSTQILKQQITPFNLRNLSSLRRVRFCALSGVIKRLRPLPKRKRLELGPSVRNRYCGYLHSNFFYGRHHGSESGTELRRMYGTFGRPFKQTRGWRYVCRGDGVRSRYGVASELQTRDAWLLVVPLSFSKPHGHTQ